MSRREWYDCIRCIAGDDHSSKKKHVPSYSMSTSISNSMLTTTSLGYLYIVVLYLNTRSKSPFSLRRKQYLLPSSCHPDIARLSIVTTILSNIRLPSRNRLLTRPTCISDLYASLAQPQQDATSNVSRKSHINIIPPAHFPPASHLT